MAVLLLLLLLMVLLFVVVVVVVMMRWWPVLVPDCRRTAVEREAALEGSSGWQQYLYGVYW